MTANHSLTAVGLGLAYGDRTVIDNLDLTVKPGAITSIVGANGCGKSTLLRSLARLLQPRHGQVLLDGKSLHEQPTKEIAKVLGLLPQSPTAGRFCVGRGIQLETVRGANDQNTFQSASLCGGHH